MSRSLAGHFLIASPHLVDRNFFRSVVLIVRHDNEHAFGFLLNRCTHVTLADAWFDSTGEKCERTEKLRVGGPLEGPLMLIHDSPEFAESEVVPEAYIATSPEMVKKALAGDLGLALPVAGYSGWGPGQLESELKVGGWMTLRATKELVFSHADDMWSIASAEVAETILPRMRTRHKPIDPQMN